MARRAELLGIDPRRVLVALGVDPRTINTQANRAVTSQDADLRQAREPRSRPADDENLRDGADPGLPSAAGPLAD